MYGFSFNIGKIKRKDSILKHIQATDSSLTAVVFKFNDAQRKEFKQSVATMRGILDKMYDKLSKGDN